MTDQPTPRTEAGHGFYDDHLHYDDLPPDRMTYVRERIVDIEDEAREQGRVEEYNRVASRMQTLRGYGAIGMVNTNDVLAILEKAR